MTIIEMNACLKTTYCPPIPTRMDLFIVDECPNCHAFFGAIRRIKANTISINVKCSNCVSTLQVSMLSNDIKVIVKGVIK